MVQKQLCSAFLIIREMQNKTILRFHLKPVRMAKISKTSGSSCCEDVEPGEHLSITSGNANLHSQYGNQCDGFLGR